MEFHDSKQGNELIVQLFTRQYRAAIHSKPWSFGAPWELGPHLHPLVSRSEIPEALAR